MSRDLLLLHDWAAERALNDEDVAARPLWAQIADEVGAYLDHDTLPGQTGPDLFEAP